MLTLPSRSAAWSQPTCSRTGFRSWLPDSLAPRLTLVLCERETRAASWNRRADYTRERQETAQQRASCVVLGTASARTRGHRGQGNGQSISGRARQEPVALQLSISYPTLAPRVSVAWTEDPGGYRPLLRASGPRWQELGPGAPQRASDFTERTTRGKKSWPHCPPPCHPHTGGWQVLLPCS